MGHKNIKNTAKIAIFSNFASKIKENFTFFIFLIFFIRNCFKNSIFYLFFEFLAYFSKNLAYFGRFLMKIEQKTLKFDEIWCFFVIFQKWPYKSRKISFFFSKIFFSEVSVENKYFPNDFNATWYFFTTWNHPTMLATGSPS